MQKKTVLVLGSNGLLGSWITPVFQSSEYRVVTHAHSGDADFTGDASQPDLLSKIIETSRPDFILNLIAATDVDVCQADPQAAYLANGEVCRLLGAISDRSTRIIQISTDHNYDGPGAKQESQVTIRNVYGLTKYVGEQFLAGKNCVILRTNFFGKSNAKKKSFTDWIYAEFQRPNPPKLFNDVFFSPVHWSTIVDGVFRCLNSTINGVFNLGSTGALSKANFCLRVADELNVSRGDCQYVSQNTVLGRAPRPSNLTMDNSKWERTFKIKAPTLSNEIKKIKEEYL